MQSSAKWRWVEYLDSSFWYWGIFLIIVERSLIEALSAEGPMRFDSVNFLKFFVTCLKRTIVHFNQFHSKNKLLSKLSTNVETTAICWWRSSIHSSSFSSSNTSFSGPPGLPSYLSCKIIMKYWINNDRIIKNSKLEKKNKYWLRIHTCKHRSQLVVSHRS